MFNISERNIRYLLDIIYKSRVIHNNRKMRLEVLNMIIGLIPCDRATYYIAKDDGNIIDPVAYNLTEEHHQRYYQYEDVDYTLFVNSSPQSRVLRETDMFSEEFRINSEYYQKTYVPLNVHYTLQLSLCHGGKFLGVITLFRSRKSGDFTDEEVRFFDLLKEHLALSLFRALHENSQVSDNPELQTCSEYNLTIRENEIISHVLSGLSNDEIASEMNISTNTVKKHLMNIYRKMDIKGRKDLFKLKK